MTINAGPMVEYANERTKNHVLSFNHLYDQIKAGSVDETWLTQIERRNNIFPDVDYRIYA